MKNSIEIKNAGTSKAREKQINALYAQIFKEKQLPDNDDMRVYERMEMVNVYELLESGEVERKDDRTVENNSSTSSIKSALLISLFLGTMILILISSL